MMTYIKIIFKIYKLLHYLQGEGDGVVAVAREEVGKNCFHGGLLLHLAVSGSQQVTVKHI